MEQIRMRRREEYSHTLLISTGPDARLLRSIPFSSPVTEEAVPTDPSRVEGLSSETERGN